jgi:hypothetical protein
MTFLEMVQKFRRDNSIQGGTPAAVTGQTGQFERIVDWIADADSEIQCLFEDWDFLRNTVTIITSSGTSTYTLAALGITAFGKWDVTSFAFAPGTTNYRALTELPFRSWQNSGLRHAADPNNEPTQFVVSKDKSIILVPTPDDTYTISADYWAAPTRLAANGDISAIPARFHQMVLELAAMKYASNENDNVMFSAAQKQYEMEWLPRLKSAELPAFRDTYLSHTPSFAISVGEHD